MNRLIALFALIAAASIAGVLVVPEIKRRIAPPATFGADRQLIAYAGKREIPRPTITPRTMVAFVFGQSNSANYGNERFHAASPAVANFWSGKYFAGEDPLLGAGGDGGGPWVLTADQLIDAGVFDSVILIAAGIGGTSVQEWTIGGRLSGMLERRLFETKDAGLTVTHFLWHQGESDSAAGAAGYDAAMQPIIALTKHYFPQSKFFVAQATICGREAAANTDLQKIQRDLARLPGVYPGPNTDAIGSAGRYDDCHFNGRGLKQHAAGWVAAIAAHAK